MNVRSLAIESLKKFINTPYRWAGNDPMEGFDCSGLVIEVLQSVGVLPANGDWTAHQLSKKFPQTDIMREGVLVFWDWDKDSIIDHVEMVAFLSEEGELFTVGASGGNSHTLNNSVAQSQNAYVKIRPLREGYKLAVDPFVK
jgi:hypothetical protein